MADRKVFHDSVVSIPVESGPAPNGLVVQKADPAHANESMDVLFSLSLPADANADLEAKVARGETVPVESLHQRYAAAQADVDALVTWLKKEGYEIQSISPDRTSVYAKAPVAKIAKSLEVDMARVTVGGLTYTAARNAPSLPSDIGEPVQEIGGLQPFRLLHKHGKRCLPHAGNLRGLEPTGHEESAAAPTTNIANAPPYLVKEVLKAYDADKLAVSGQGQTIAILIDTFPRDSDLKAFWKHNNLPVTMKQIQKVNVRGGPLPHPEGEETLDAEWTSGIAPGATIRIYATGSLRFVDLDFALDRILADLPSHPGMRQLSISLGLGETYLNGPGGEVAIEHQKFLKLAAAGVNVFVSTGDAGSNPDQTGQSATGPLQAEYESSDPCVVAVGGTSLKLTASGHVASEVGWSNGGGGKSQYFKRPAWQTGSGVSGTRRLVPDVSATADPNEGGFVVLGGAVQQYGGTSWSAPIWAGFCALINEARTKASKPPLPFLNPLLYPLRAKCFRDISSGSNGAYHAVPAAYDLVSGLGVPSMSKLVAALA
jgi:kumamolisin